MEKFLKNFLKVSIIVLIISISSYWAGLHRAKVIFLSTPPACIVNGQEKENIDFSVFWESWKYLENRFLDKNKIDYEKMIYGAVKGMVSSLDDPYTTFFDPKENSEFNEELSGKYEGVGMEVAIKDDFITVVTPLSNTPAKKAGLKPKDIILKIDETSAKGISLEKAVSLIKGPKGTSVKLLISREGWTKPREFVLKRSLIKIPTIEWELKNNDVAYIKIYQFNKILESEFQKISSEILSSPAKKIILDLRNNPGGFLHVVQDISGWFLEKGKVVVIEDFGDEKKDYKVNGPSVFAKYPIVILINGGTASASEILAGALRDNRGVKLIGEKSFGKGSVQEQIPLFDDSSIKITVARWLTPNGQSINEKGLVPDIEVKAEEKKDIFDNTEKDRQLEKALQTIGNL